VYTREWTVARLADSIHTMNKITRLSCMGGGAPAGMELLMGWLMSQGMAHTLPGKCRYCPGYEQYANTHGVCPHHLESVGTAWGMSGVTNIHGSWKSAILQQTN